MPRKALFLQEQNSVTLHGDKRRQRRAARPTSYHDQVEVPVLIHGHDSPVDPVDTDTAESLPLSVLAQTAPHRSPLPLGILTDSGNYALASCTPYFRVAVREKHYRCSSGPIGQAG